MPLGRCVSRAWFPFGCRQAADSRQTASVRAGQTQRQVTARERFRDEERSVLARELAPKGSLEDWPVMPVARRVHTQAGRFFDRNPTLDVPRPPPHCPGNPELASLICRVVVGRGIPMV
jgi:hypothetical protein